LPTTTSRARSGRSLLMPDTSFGRGAMAVGLADRLYLLGRH
jgi:hypothetical protein